jgi:hypothetical protein
MAGEADQNPPVTTELADGGNKSNSGMESDAPSTSSFATMAVINMADNQIPEISDYYKKSNVTEANRQAYHDFDWLAGNMISSIPEVDVPTTHGSTVVCFESHLVVGLGLPPSKFLVAIMYFLGCEPVHFNPNAIATLSCSTMLCECWLGIALDTSLFYYFYSLARYNKVVYSGIVLSLRRHRIHEYIDATFKSSWWGSQSKWFLVDMHVEPQWANKQLYSPLVDKKQGEPKMTSRLATLVKRVAELHAAGLQARHCVEEFTLRWIRPLGRQEKLAYDCPWLADPCCEPTVGKIFNLHFYY